VLKKNLFLYIFLFFNFLLFSKSSFYISDTGWEFGDVLEGAILEHKLVLGNRGDKDKDIFFRSGCPCIRVSKERIILKSRKEQDVKIEFNTREEKGEIYKNIYIEVKDEEMPVLEYPVTGKVFESIDIFYFYERGCSRCERIEKRINEIEENFKINLVKYEIDKKENFEKFLEFEKKSGKKISGFPVIFVLNKGYSEKNIDLLLNSLKKGLLYVREVKEDELKWSFLPFISAALLDGINPCAFSVIIIMLTYLSLFGRKRKFIFVSGILYTLGVFLTYFLFGVGIIKFLKVLSEVAILKRILFLFFGCLSLFLMIFSFKDFLNLISGNKGKIFLKVPSGIQFKVVSFVEKLAEKKYFVFISFFAGVVVSVIEFICTGQVYLPSLSYMIGVKGLKLKSLFYLFIYNILFILPMFVVFLLFFFGVKVSIFEKAISGRRMIFIKFFHFLIFLFFTVFFIIRGIM